MDETTKRIGAGPRVRQRRVLAAVSSVLLAVAGATASALGPGSETGRGAPLLIATAGGLSALDPETGDALFDVGGALATPSGSLLVRARPEGTGTRLVTVDTASREERPGRWLPGQWTLRLVSNEGSSVVLTPPRSGGDDPYRPEGRTTTVVLVAPVADRGDPRRFDLEGNYEPEAISTDASSVFVIEYTPALSPSRYQVRRLDLRSGQVVDVYSPDKELQRSMGGTARTQALAPDGRRLYTLYTLDGQEGPIAFIHVLSLDEQWAHCIDLPAGIGVGSPLTTSLAVSPDGGSLYVIDGDRGRIAEVDTRALRVARTRPFDGTAVHQALPSAALATDRALYLASGAGVFAFDRLELEQTALWNLPGPVVGLDAADNGLVYLALANETYVLDPATGILGALGPATRDPTGSVRGSPLRGGLQCAC